MYSTTLAAVADIWMGFSWIGVTGKNCGFLGSSGCPDLTTVIHEMLVSQVQPGDVVVVSHASYKFDEMTSIRFYAQFHQSVLQPKGVRLLIMGDPPIIQGRDSSRGRSDRFA